MKSQVNASPQRSLLGLQVLEAVLADERRRPASASAPISSTGTYLVAARISTSGPGRARAPRRGAPGCLSGSRSVNWRTPAVTTPVLEPGEAGLAARALAVAAVGVEEVGVAGRAEIGWSRPRSTPARSSSARATAGRSSIRGPRRRLRCRRTRPAPRRRPRSSRGRSRGRRRRRCRRPAPPRPRRSRPPGRASRRGPMATPPGPGDRDRQAVGDHHQRHQARAGRWRGRRPRSGCGTTSAKTAGSWGESCQCSSAPWTWRPMTTFSGAIAQRRGEARGGCRGRGPARRRS